MRSEDFYTGEPVSTGSPPMFSNQNVIGSTDEAASMASFGAYAYDPSYRNSQMMYPGGYGYNTGQFPMNPPQTAVYPGIGIPPSPYPGYAQVSQYGNIQPSYGMFKTGYGNIPQPNPVFQQGLVNPNTFYQNQYQQQIPTQYHIPGVNIGGEYMPPADYSERLAELEMGYYTSIINQQAKQEVDMMANNSVYGYGYNSGFNYYGTPFYNQYQYSTADMNLRKQVEKLQNEARENRMVFNLNISRLAHNFNRDSITDEQIKERYEGRNVEIPTYMVPNQQEAYDQYRFSQMVPFDNSSVYREHFLKVKEEFNKIIPENSNMKDTFMNMGIIDAQYTMEEEMHRRRDGGSLYNNTDNSYKRLIRKKAKERYALEKGIILSPDDNTAQQLPLGFNAQTAKQNFIDNSVLKDSCTLQDDGTLNVSLKLPCNFGTHAGQTYSVNSNEAHYDEKRQRFAGFIDSIPGSIDLDKIKREKVEGYDYG